MNWSYRTIPTDVVTTYLLRRQATQTRPRRTVEGDNSRSHKLPDHSDMRKLLRRHAKKETDKETTGFFVEAEG